jgi:hypothetical protein
MQLTTTIRNNMLSQISAAGGAGGTLVFYTGTPPGIGNAASGTTLVTLTGVTYGTAASGQMSLSATAVNASASGTPGYARVLTSGAAVVGEFTAGVGTAGTTGTVTVSSGAVATVPLGTGGSGYPAGTYSLPCIVTGGGGNDAVVLANIASNAVASFSIVAGGFNYTSAPTVIVPPPFDFSFNTTVSNGGLVSLTSGTFTASNP